MSADLDTRTARRERSLRATADWLELTIEKGQGGSCAHLSPLGWSKPYPETTGYLIPTLHDLGDRLPGFDGDRLALGIGEWLLSIQLEMGMWRGLLHPNPEGDPSVFNSAQILHGLSAMHERTGEERWLDSARRCGQALAERVSDDGLWPGGDYRSDVMPSYYAFAAWPLLEVGLRSGEEAITAAARAVLDSIVARRRESGSFDHWGFRDDQAAPTHTIAYTLQGLIESSRLLGDWSVYGASTETALDRMATLATGRDGKLPGRLGFEFEPEARFICLTGNAQTAICLLEWCEQEDDPGRRQAAAALADAVCGVQRLGGPRSLRGAVTGSWPPWGGYMFMRCPNWAAKFHCDALLMLERASGPTG